MFRKGVTIIGWHNDNNTGDDAMLQVLVWLLLKKHKRLTVYMLCKKENIPTYRNSEVRYIPLLSKHPLGSKLYKAILPYRVALFSSLLLFGGGSIFHSLNSITWKKIILSTFLKWNKNGIAGAVGVSIGPFKDSAAEFLWQKMLSSLNFVVVRDVRSYDILNQINRQIQIRKIIMPDLAFLLPNTIENSVMPHKLCKKRIGVSMTKHIESSGNRRFTTKHLAEAIVELANSNCIDEVVLFTFCESSINGDELIVNKVNEYIKPYIGVVIIEYNKNPIVLLNEFRLCQFVICMRYHSQIFASITRTPFITIAYHQKNIDFVKDMYGESLPVLSLNSATMKELIDKSNYCFQTKLPEIKVTNSQIGKIVELL